MHGILLLSLKIIKRVLKKNKLLLEIGVEMASELATQIEPLIHIASISLRDTDSFLTTLTGIKLDYHEAKNKEQPRPHSAVIHRRYILNYCAANS